MSHFFLDNWQRKLIALFTAIIVWIFVNQSITELKILPNVAVRVINLPYDKTIVGLLPNGYLSNRITLTLSGSKEMMQSLESSDLEVLLDGSTAGTDDWVVQIAKKNLVSLNPDLDLRHYITSVQHPEFVLKLSQLITDKVPIIIKNPVGQAPEGYEFLDIWPEQLMQTVSGPKEEVQDLKIKGLRLILDMSKITKEDLENSRQTGKESFSDEISFLVPEKWKFVPIPFRHNIPVELNDPAAKELRINFLKKQFLPINRNIPVSIFYPLKYSKTLNPKTQSLSDHGPIEHINDIPVYTTPLYAKGVSNLFLDIIRDNITIVIVSAPKQEREVLQWSIEVIDPHEMEDTFVAYELSKKQNDLSNNRNGHNSREEVMRQRFREYLQQFTLHTADGSKLDLHITSSDDKVIIRNGNAG